jgi:hypothetical protein
MFYKKMMNVVAAVSFLSFLFCINIEAGDKLHFYTKVNGEMKAILDGDQSRTMIDYKQSNSNNRWFVIKGKRYTLDDATNKFFPVHASTGTGVKNNSQNEYTIEHDDYIMHNGKYYQVEWFNEDRRYGNIGGVTYECKNSKLKVNTGVSWQWPSLKTKNITPPPSSYTASHSSSGTPPSSSSPLSTRRRSRSLGQSEENSNPFAQLKQDIKEIESKVSKNEGLINALQANMQILLAWKAEFDRLIESERTLEKANEKLQSTLNPLYKKPMDYLATAAMTVMPALQWKSLLIPMIKAAMPKIITAAITPTIAPWVAPALAVGGGCWWVYTTYIRKKAYDIFNRSVPRDQKIKAPWRVAVYGELETLLDPLTDFAKIGVSVGLSVLILSNQKTSLPVL